MAQTFVQGNVSASASTATQTVTNAAAANVAGNFLIAIIRQLGAGAAYTAINSVADSANGTYTFLASVQQGTTDRRLDVYYRQNIAAATTGSNTLTVTFASSLFGSARIGLQEFSGVLKTGSPADVTSVGGSGTTGTATSGNLTTVTTGDLIVGYGTCSASFSGAGTSWTLDSLTGMSRQYRLGVSIGTYASDFAGASPGTWAAIICAFKAAPTTLFPTLTASSSGTFSQLTKAILRADVVRF